MTGTTTLPGTVPEAGISRRAVLGAGASAWLAACAPGGAAPLTWWAIGSTGENAPLLIPPFKRATGIAVDIQTVPWTGAHEKLLTGFAGRSLPDVMMLNSAWLPELALLGALAPPPSGSPLLTGQLQGALASVMVGGRALAVPWTADAWVQYYRPDLLAEVGYAAPPLDWSEWSRMAAALKRRHPERYATLHLIDWPEPLLGFAAQQPDPLLTDQDTRGNFSSAGFRAALSFYKSIFDRKFSPVVSGVEAGDNYINFRRGWFAILPSDAVTIGDMRRRQQAFPPGSWGAVATPGPRGPGAGLARGTSLAVSRDARHPIQAWQLIEYLCSSATQRRIYASVGDLPTRTAAWADPLLAEDPVSRVFAAQIERDVVAPAVPEWQRIVSEIQLVAEHMVRGDYGVDAAARIMDERADRILQKRRWLLDRGRLA